MTTSLSKQRQHGSGEGQPGSVVWFISFGDLLTLLLCFFLVLTPWQHLKRSPDVESLRGINADSVPKNPSGTTLASDPALRGSVIKLELPLFEGAWQAGGDHLSSGELLSDLRGLMSVDARADVLVCAPPEERVSIIRYVGEAFDSGIGSISNVRFVVAERCDESAVLAPIIGRVVGRIRIVGT
jgi:hypothetical protein